MTVRQAAVVEKLQRDVLGVSLLEKDDLVQVGGFFLPVHPLSFSRDDGKPIME